jgi:hypothetical protein
MIEKVKFAYSIQTVGLVVWFRVGWLYQLVAISIATRNAIRSICFSFRRRTILLRRTNLGPESDNPPRRLRNKLISIAWGLANPFKYLTCRMEGLLVQASTTGCTVVEFMLNGIARRKGYPSGDILQFTLPIQHAHPVTTNTVMSCRKNLCS